MPELQRCTKCKVLVDVKELGVDKVCTNCMEMAISMSTTGKAVILSKAGEADKNLPSISEAATALGVSISTVRNRIVDGKDTDGWVVTYATV
jgi:predicted RNA-binding Zn-ribbon protein involved in translation (DUF1610 family)